MRVGTLRLLVVRDPTTVGEAGTGLLGGSASVEPLRLFYRLTGLASGSVGGCREDVRMAKYGADYLTRLLDAVAGFQNAFEAWMETQVESDHMSARGLFPTVWTREGEDEATVRALELAVAEAAGLAASTVAVTGAYIGVQGLGAIDPIANWSMMRNPKAFLSPQDVRTTAATVRGRLQAMLADADADADAEAAADPMCPPSHRHTCTRSSGQPPQLIGQRISTGWQSVKPPRG